MHRILVGLDKSATAKVVHRAALALAQATHGKLLLFRVVEGAGEIDMPNRSLVAEAKLALDELAREGPPELALGSDAVTSDTPWRAICEAARRHHADLIVIGAHAHGPVARALGTTAASTVNHAPCSVLVVRNGG